MGKLLTIGNATLDIIISVEQFPVEDRKMRALGQDTRRGGNASNTSEVLAQLGHDVSLLAPFADDEANRFIRLSLERRGVKLHYCPTFPQSISPTSYILYSASAESRTIVHCRELPELSNDALSSVPLSEFDLIHFEGRNIDVTKQLLSQVKAGAPNVLLSLEVEKPRPDIESLIAYADLVIFSNSYYGQSQCTSMESFFGRMRTHSDSAIMVCSRGAKGAYGQAQDLTLYHSPAFDFGTVQDTVGAGDTFNAGLLASLADQCSLEQSLRNACLLASKKVSQYGFDELHSFDLDAPERLG